MTTRSKVFGIGFQRTGTVSLARALNLLGIKTLHYPVALFHNLDDPLLEEFEGFADNPLPLIYQELDRRYPNSRFILTDRNVESWLESVEWLFRMGPRIGDWGTSPTSLAMHTALYGTTTFDEAVFRQRFLRHRAEVLAHFKDRPRDLLVIDFASGEGWKELCPFLGRAVPSQPFPHENRRIPLFSLRGLRFLMLKLRGRIRKVLLPGGTGR